MSYLYGDSTPTTLESNFLEFLRDGVDFAVSLLEADAGIKRGKARIQRNNEAVEAELGRLAFFIGVVTKSIRDGEKGAANSATAACATYLEKHVADSERASIAAMQARLAQYVASVDAEEAAIRAACFKALETLLSLHDPPETTTATRVVLVQPGRYDATVDGRAPFGLAWTFALAAPDGTIWSSPVRIERIAPNLEIRAPQLAGWISKEVKVRPLKLDRHVVTELVLEKGVVQVKLRLEPGIESGFDFSVDLAAKTVQAFRVGTAEGDASVGAFDLVAGDGALIVDLAQKLSGGVSQMTRQELTAATWQGEPFRNVPSFIDVVEKLVAMMAPITREISARALKPTELVLRRMLGNGRREELFVEKATLREKYAGLSPPLRQFFAPLGLDLASAAPASTPAPEPESLPPPTLATIEQPTERAEIARSQRPPPLPGPAADGDGASDALNAADALEALDRLTPPSAIDASGNAKPDDDDAKSAMAERSAEQVEATRSAPPDSGPSIEVLAAADPLLSSMPPTILSSIPPSTPPSTPPSSTASSTPPSPVTPSVTPSAKPPAETVSSTPPAPTEGELGLKLPPPLPVEAQAEAQPTPDAAGVPPERESSSGPIARLDKEAASKNVELVAALKKIASLARSGRTDEGYREYAALFSSSSFASYRPEEQRQALKLMVLAKSPPAKSAVVIDAYRAARARLEALTKASSEPVDLEMLGATHVMCDDPQAANGAFARALEIERARDPSSALIASLMSRVASL